MRAAASDARAAEPRHLFTFGFGYTTLALVNHAKQTGWCGGGPQALQMRSKPHVHV
jgi:hypothetical protein